MNKDELIDSKLFYNKGYTFTDGEREIIFDVMDEWSNQENKELKEIVIQLQKDFVLKLEEVKKQECIALIDFMYFNWSVIEDMSEKQVYEFYIQSKQ